MKMNRVVRVNGAPLAGRVEERANGEDNVPPLTFDPRVIVFQRSSESFGDYGEKVRYLEIGWKKKKKRNWRIVRVEEMEPLESRGARFLTTVRPIEKYTRKTRSRTRPVIPCRVKSEKWGIHL